MTAAIHMLSLLPAIVGCRSMADGSTAATWTADEVAGKTPAVTQTIAHDAIAMGGSAQARQASLQEAVSASDELSVGPSVTEVERLADLEAWAVANNPGLRRLAHEASAAWAKAAYVDQLPDPTLGSMVFGDAMNFVPDRQLAELQFMQMLPWLERLRAESQQAQFEALAADNLYEAERLRLVGEVRATWCKLYVLRKQIETISADRAQLDTLIKTASARVAAGDAQPGDVLMATLELSSLEEQLLSYRQQVASAAAEFNRLLGRDIATPVHPPEELAVEFPDWDQELLQRIARGAQPELHAARLRSAATRWGIEVAQLRRRPDLTLGASWMVMSADSGASMPGAGADAWTLNFSATIPIWQRKNDAQISEASRAHQAAHAAEDDIAARYDALLVDLWQQAQATRATIELYETTILPQARQLFEANQQALINNSVPFERVVRDRRSVLALELARHRAVGQLASTLARIRQTVGVDLLAKPEPSGS